jgi:hypothetical protein
MAGWRAAEARRMPGLEARKVKLVGGGITADGDHGALVFSLEQGEQFALAVGVEQFADLLKTAALLHSQLRKRHGDAVGAIPVEMWSTSGTPGAAILSLQVFGGLELRFEVSRGTQSSNDASNA